MTERWLPVPGYEGYYEVSDRGSVRSVDRVTTHGRRRKSQPIRGNYAKGYLLVQLNKDGEVRMAGVHTLVAAAFIGPRPDGLHVCHNDGQRDNNVLSNLRYGTPESNQADRKLHGTGCEGERNPIAKLTDEAVREIRLSAERGTVLARRFGVSRHAVHLARARKSWRHL